MKIVKLVTFLAGGGAEHFVVGLSNQLTRENEVYLVTILDDRKEAKVRNSFRSGISDSVHYVSLGLPSGLELSSRWRVYTALRAFNPDVIRVHMVLTLEYSALAIELLSFSKKMYFSIHGDLHDGYDRGLLRLYYDILGRLDRFKLSCLSERGYADSKAFYSRTLIRYITNGRAPIVSTDLFRAVSSEMNLLKNNTSSLPLTHVARCHPIKNQKLLIGSVNILVQEGYNIDLTVVGAEFNTPGGQSIVSMVYNRIHFVGPRKNVADYMLDASIFCLSSNFEEIPITLLEASLAGPPAVNTPVCRAVDSIKDDINDFLSKSRSLEDYKNALIKAIDNYDSTKANTMSMKDNSPYTTAECTRKYVGYFDE